MTRTLWTVIGSIVAVVLVVLYVSVGRSLTPFLKALDRVEVDAAAKLADVDKKDAAIRDLSAEIGRLRKEADAERDVRVRAVGSADELRRQVRDLSVRAAELSAAAKARVPVGTVKEAHDALARRGL